MNPMHIVRKEARIFTFTQFSIMIIIGIIYLN